MELLYFNKAFILSIEIYPTTSSSLTKKVGVPLAPEPLAKKELRLTIFLTSSFDISIFNFALLISRSSIICFSFALFKFPSTWNNALFEVKGNLNNAKLKQIIENLELNDAKLNIDMTKDEVNNVVRLSSFLANGSGARGTPTFFVNEELVVGYISIERMKALLK